MQNGGMLVATIKRDLIVKHSKTVADILEANPSKSDIEIRDVSKGPLAHVIKMIKEGKPPLKIGVSREPFKNAICILEAVNALEVQPSQPQVEGHVIYTITQHKITAAQVEVIQAASPCLGTDSRIYKAMVQAVAYNVVHNCFKPEELKAIKEVALKSPTLDKTILDKVNELKRRNEAHQQMLAEKRARAEAREKRRAENEVYRQYLY